MADATLLPTNPSFAGHQTFALRSGWLKKGIDAISDVESAGPTIFSRDDALVALGVGKNMVTSMRHWLLVTRFARESVSGQRREVSPTTLGQALFGSDLCDGWDPFLEDEGTLWLIHWQLAGPQGLAFSWIYAFNRFREYEFSKETLVEATLVAANGAVSKPLSKETIQRDIECLLHTYVSVSGAGADEDNLDCPLQSLGLIRPSYDHHFRFQFGHKPFLPRQVFLYALLTFWNWKQPNAASLPTWDITYTEGSPGQVFKLDDDSVMDYLDAIAADTRGAFEFQDEGIIREVVRNTAINFDPIELLEAYYHV